MANVFVYSVFDKQVEAFMKPFEARSDGEAKRIFSVSFADRNPNRFQVPAGDLDLFLVGEWNDLIGEFGVPASLQGTLPKRVMTGLEAERLARKSFSPAAEPEIPFEPL